jgi:glycosyltransferase involved in cell wall biosynthesis
LQNPALAKQFGAAGRQRVEENFSADRMVEGMIAVYNSVLNAGSDLWFPEKG